MNHNILSSIDPVSVYGNVDFSYTPDLACSRSMLAKSAKMPLPQENKGPKMNELDRQYMELIIKTNAEKSNGNKVLRNKFKTEYEEIISKSKSELKKSQDVASMKKSLSRLIRCFKWLDEKQDMSDYLNYLLADKNFHTYTSYVIKIYN